MGLGNLPAAADSRWQEDSAANMSSPGGSFGGGVSDWGGGGGGGAGMARVQAVKYICGRALRYLPASSRRAASLCAVESIVRC